MPTFVHEAEHKAPLVNREQLLIEAEGYAPYRGEQAPPVISFA